MTENCPVSVVEPRHGWWTEDGGFGSRIQTDLPSVAGAEIDCFSIDKLPGPPRPLAFNLFRSNTNFPSGGGRGSSNSELYAKITYGAGGISHSFLLDATLGTQLSLVAGTVRLIFVSYAPNGSAAYTVPASGEAILGATLGLGSVSPASPPTFTTQYFSVANGATQSWPVHPFARRVWPFQPATSGLQTWTNVTLTLRREGGANQQKVQLGEVGPELYTQGLPIPGASFEAVLTNSSGATRSMGLVFELGL
jgi:hypothetical protein